MQYCNARSRTTSSLAALDLWLLQENENRIDGKTVRDYCYAAMMEAAARR
jgi:hypothetical protein